MLDIYRKQVEKLDLKLLKLIHERFLLIDKIADYKRKHKIQSYQRKREQELFALYMEKSQKLEIDPIAIKKVFHLLFELSRKRQQQRSKQRLTKKSTKME